MQPASRYARIERERRFLLSEFPAHAKVVEIRRIADFYIDGTGLRLRELIDASGCRVFKLTQKVPMRGDGAQQGLITNIYLTADEFRVLGQLSARKLSKTRHSVRPFGIDVFEGALEGLILAEAEFDSADAAAALTLPSYIRQEVTADERFTGGQLVRASRSALRAWLLDYGIQLGSDGET